MASDDTMTFQFHSSLQDEDVENDTDDGYHHHHHHPPNLSRLSVCTCCVDDDVDGATATYMSGLSIEGDDGDADAEFSDGKELLLSSDSDENELSSRYPLPATAPRVKVYASGSESQKAKEKDPRRKRHGGRMRKDTRVWEGSKKNRSKSEKKDKEQVMKGFSTGESDESGSRVITRPKGGRRSLCMDLDEVKACRDLGFDLELDIPLPSPLSLSLSNSTLDASSAATSLVTNWRISSPGDDPRDVKARLKMWAQAVAASASKYGT
ncbi:hypothetical protein E2542_SST23914 [Spatholobus suberectus]|nr:hypothetical protein E2542_SST23914 [Spatholobus suberectus]